MLGRVSPAMMTPARLANVVLALAVLGFAGCAYWEHQLRLDADASLAALARERVELRKQAWTRRNQASNDAAPAPERAAQGRDTSGLPDELRNQRVGDVASRFQAMMDSPEAQRLLALQQKGALDSRYGPLFRSLHLTPEQLDHFKSLLVEKQNAMMDVMAAARTQGLNMRDNRTELTQMVQATRADVDASIRAALGDAGFAQYRSFEQTLPQRNTVGQLESRLSYSDQPLTAQQSDQMISIMAANPASGRGSAAPAAGAPMRVAAFGGGSTAAISDAAIEQSQSVLSATQMQALQQLQQEQQAQARLRQLMRTQAQGGPAAATPPPPPTPQNPPKG